MDLSYHLAAPADAPTVANLRNAVADGLVKRYGPGHWGYLTSEKSVALGISSTSKVLLASIKNKVVGTLRLAKKKPWAIDPAYFTPVKFPLYLLDMAVSPELQGKKVGTQMIREALRIAAAWPSDAVRLDAYDTEAGAGAFYLKCGFQPRGRVVYRKTPLVYFEWLLSNHS